MMRSDDDIPGWLHWAIREEAGRYEPDRAHMNARVRAAMPARGWRSRLRVAGASLAAATAVAATTAVVWQGFAGRDPTPAGPVADGASPTSSAPRTSAVPSGAASPMATEGSPVPAPRETASVVPQPAGTGPFLRCAGTVDRGSNAYWTQESVKLTTERRLSELRVTVWVARTRGIDPSGAFVNLPSNDFMIIVRERDGMLSYQFVLKEGRTVPRGTWIFAVQYKHSESRRHGGFDTYSVTATTTGGAHTQERGHF